MLWICSGAGVVNTQAKFAALSESQRVTTAWWAKKGGGKRRVTLQVPDASDLSVKVVQIRISEIL